MYNNFSQYIIVQYPISENEEDLKFFKKEAECISFLVSLKNKKVNGKNVIDLTKVYSRDSTYDTDRPIMEVSKEMQNKRKNRMGGFFIKLYFENGKIHKARTPFEKGVEEHLKLFKKEILKNIIVLNERHSFDAKYYLQFEKNNKK